MAEQPVLLRLEELETWKEMAERVDEVRLVIGSKGLEKLLPAQLLGAAKALCAAKEGAPLNTPRQLESRAPD